MRYERGQSKRDVRKSAERYNRKGDKCDEVIAAECKDHESGKKEEDRYEQESRQRFDERQHAEPVHTARKVLSDMCADMGWMVSLSKLKIPTSPLLQKGSHEG